MTTNNELLPCPFCGCKRIFVQPDEVGSGGQWVAPIHVGCNDCKAEQQGDDELSASANWNRRQHAMPADAWQPIETAPKCGVPVLLFARLETADASTRVVGAYIEDRWLAQSYVGQVLAVLIPSHWMPLPAFPSHRIEGK